MHRVASIPRVSIQRQSCPFHGDEDVQGVPTEDGLYSFTCDRTRGHPAGKPFSWLHDPQVPAGPELTGLAEELGLAQELPAALASLGKGWFEYGLIERAYAKRRPADFKQMVSRWGHTALAPAHHTVSSYLAGTLGRLSTHGAVFYRPGKGTGRWSYNDRISYWSLDPEADWESRTTWVSVIGDHDPESRKADRECREYVNAEGTQEDRNQN